LFRLRRRERALGTQGDRFEFTELRGTPALRAPNPVEETALKMAKRKKSRAELEAIVLAELRQTLNCTDVSSVVVVGSKHGAFTWEVESYIAARSPFLHCEQALRTIVPRLQAAYDLASERPAKTVRRWPE
jgi:hypothetical protein